MTPLRRPWALTAITVGALALALLLSLSLGADAISLVTGAAAVALAFALVVGLWFRTAQQSARRQRRRDRRALARARRRERKWARQQARRQERGLGRPHARYPALPLPRDRLAPGAVIFLGDVHGADEREIVRHWSGEVEGLAVVEPRTALGVARLIMPGA